MPLILLSNAPPFPPPPLPKALLAIDPSGAPKSLLSSSFSSSSFDQHQSESEALECASLAGSDATKVGRPSVDGFKAAAATEERTSKETKKQRGLTEGGRRTKGRWMQLCQGKSAGEDLSS